MISINWATQVITVPQADLTNLGGGVYELDVDWFRLQLKDLEDGEEGMAFPDTHRHNTEVTLGGLTLARVVEIINGYTVTFENGSYAVNLVGANNNISDVTNVNSVSVRSSNSAGLITVASGSGLSVEQAAMLEEVWKRLGLDAANPLVNTPTEISAGPDVVLAVDQTGSTVTTTRQ